MCLRGLLEGMEVKGVGGEKAIPGEGEAGLEPTQLRCEDGEGHSEAEAPDGHSSIPFPVSERPCWSPEEGRTCGEQLPQEEGEAHDWREAGALRRGSL